MCGPNFVNVSANMPRNHVIVLIMFLLKLLIFCVDCTRMHYRGFKNDVFFFREIDL